jgi:hypothetical protein
MTTLTAFQLRCVMALRREPNAIASSTAIGHRARVARIAVPSAMRSLERRGLAHSFPSDNSQWAVKLWALTPRGRAEIPLSPAPARPS